MKRTFFATIVCTALALSLAGSPAIATPSTTAPLPEPADEIEDQAVTNITTLALLFSEAPMSTTSLIGETNCGASGHCNFAACAEPACPQGQSPYCTCSVTSTKCEDKHDWWDPTDNDEHNMYNCTCGCTSSDPDPDPGDCRVHDPLTGNCLIGNGLPSRPDVPRVVPPIGPAPDAPKSRFELIPGEMAIERP